MSNALRYLWDRVMAGLYLILPFLVLLLLFREVLHFVFKLLGPVAKHMPTAGLTGPAADYFIAALALVVVAFLLGLLAAIPTVRKVSDKVERVALGRIPGLTILKSMFGGSHDVGGVQVLLVTLDDAWLFGFLMEELPDGMLAVFVPGVPSPMSGSLYFFAEHQVRRTDLSVRDAMRCLTRLGVGAGRFVTGRLSGSA